MARLALPAPGAMTSEQRTVCEEVVAGQRGKIPSPMIAWIENPDLARRAQQLGEVLRFQTSLDQRLVELAILVCARHWTAHQVWTSHARYARQFELDEAVIAAVAARVTPAFTDDRERLVYEVSVALLERGRIGNDLYREAITAFQARGVVELVAIVGYYGLVGLTANAFEIGLPQNFATELAENDPAGPLP